MNIQCVICQNMMSSSNKKQPCAFRDCGHVFHRQCVEPWIRDNKSCPNCRKPVLETSLINLFFSESATQASLMSAIAENKGLDKSLEQGTKVKLNSLGRQLSFEAFIAVKFGAVVWDSEEWYILGLMLHFENQERRLRCIICDATNIFHRDANLPTLTEFQRIVYEKVLQDTVFQVLKTLSEGCLAVRIDGTDCNLSKFIHVPRMFLEIA